MNTTTAFRNLAMAAVAFAMLLVASLVLAPSAWAASQYGIVKSDGYLHQTDESATADYGVVWGQTESECRNALDGVTTLFIDSKTTSIATVKVQWKWGSTNKNQVITLSGNRGEMGTHNLHLIFFLKSNGRSNLSQMQDWYQFADLKSLVGVGGLEYTSLRSIPNGCFAGCNNLYMFGGSSCMPNVTTIGSAAFRDCDSLKSIKIPASVTQIGSGPMNDGAFRGCDSLKKIVLNSSNRVSFDSGTFDYVNSGCKFYVPNSAYSKYREKTSSNKWSTSGLASKVHPFLEIASVGKATYTGKALKPAVTVKWIGEQLSAGNYSVAYSNNVKAGTGKVTVTGDSSHNGKASKSFTIAKAKQPLTVKANNKTVGYSKVKKAKVVLANAVTVSKAKGSVSYAKAGGSAKLSVNKTTGKITVAKGTKKGSYTVKVKVTAKGNANYAAGSKTVSVKVTVK